MRTYRDERLSNSMTPSRPIDFDPSAHKVWDIRNHPGCSGSFRYPRPMAVADNIMAYSFTIKPIHLMHYKIAFFQNWIIEQIDELNNIIKWRKPLNSMFINKHVYRFRNYRLFLLVRAWSMIVLIYLVSWHKSYY